MTLMNESVMLRAWNEIIEDKEVAQECYLSLYEEIPYYGGPEEGGWWGHLHILKQYCKCPTLDYAEELRKKLEIHCKELTEEAKRANGEHCLHYIQQAEARNEDVDDYGYDGPMSYYVIIESVAGQNQVTERSHYE